MTISSTPLPRPAALHEQTYQALRKSIISGDLEPGDRLIETQLARHLQVSRTPVREAIRQLQQDGLAIADPQGGMRIVTLSSQDAEQLYDCRIALESLSVAEACRLFRGGHLQHLEYLFEQAEAVDLDRTGDLSLFQRLNADYQFHHHIAENSGNSWLMTLLDQVFDKMMLLRIQTTRHDPNVLNIGQEHRQIFDAIARGQPEAAIAAVKDHLTASKRRVVAAIIDLQNS